MARWEITWRAPPSARLSDGSDVATWSRERFRRASDNDGPGDSDARARLEQTSRRSGITQAPEGMDR